MERNIESTYPSKIDKSVFFSDMRLRDSDCYEKYKLFIKEKKYDKASEWLQDSEVENYYGAYLYNLFNRRLRAIGEYLIEQSVNKPEQVHYQSEEPTAQVGRTWIS